MKNNKVEFLLDLYFKYKNMNIYERNFIITMLYNTKELKDNQDMKIVTCNIKKIKNGMYHADGMIHSSLSENRCFESYINIENTNISIKSEIIKICSEDINKGFTEYTLFTKIGDDMYHRQTKYSHVDKCFESDIIVDNCDIIYQDFKGREKR